MQYLQLLVQKEKKRWPLGLLIRSKKAHMPVVAAIGKWSEGATHWLEVF